MKYLGKNMPEIHPNFDSEEHLTPHYFAQNEETTATVAAWPVLNGKGWIVETWDEINYDIEYWATKKTSTLHKLIASTENV